MAVALRRVTKGALDQPQVQAFIFGLIIAGLTPPEICKKLAEERGMIVSRQSIHGFERRHAAHIADLKLELRQRVEEAAISNKEERVRRLSALWDELVDFKRENGLTMKETKLFGEVEVETEYFNGELVKQLRGVLDDVAKEMGERRPINVNVDARTQNLTIVEVLQMAAKCDADS